MNLSDRDLQRLVRSACPPVDPSPALRARVLLAATPRRGVTKRVLRIVLPYAAGIVSVLAAQRVMASSDRAAGRGPAYPFESIADRPPAAAPAPTAAPDTDPAPTTVAYVPVPRIS